MDKFEPLYIMIPQCSIVDNGIEITQQRKENYSMIYGNPISGFLSKIRKNLKKIFVYLFSKYHYICISQDMEVTQMSTE